LPKRAFDLVLSATLLAVLSPVILLTWGAVAFLLGRPAIVGRSVVGLGGRTFRQYRFRIAPDAAGRNRRSSGVALHDWLRATGVGEIPALLNVLKGEMSIVGPYPRSQRELLLCGPAGADLLRARPGVISPSRHPSRARLPARKAAALDQHYVRSARAVDDIRLLMRALIAVRDR